MLANIVFKYKVALKLNLRLGPEILIVMHFRVALTETNSYLTHILYAGSIIH